MRKKVTHDTLVKRWNESGKMPVINGYALTRHALERGFERKVHARDVEAALKHGRLERGKRYGVHRIVGDKAVAVIDTHTKHVLTIYAA